MSYSSAAARNSRRRLDPAATTPASQSNQHPSHLLQQQPQSSISSQRPLHARQHSANTAGDVFAVLGGRPSSSLSSSRERTAAQARHPQVAPPALPDATTELEGLSRTSGTLDNATKAPSSSRLPNSSAKVYSKPVLLKLWSPERSVDIPLEDVYSAFEPPERQLVQDEGGAGTHHHGRYHAGSQYGERGSEKERERERPGLTSYRNRGAVDIPSAASFGHQRGGNPGSFVSSPPKGAAGFAGIQSGPSNGFTSRRERERGDRLQFGALSVGSGAGGLHGGAFAGISPAPASTGGLAGGSRQHHHHHQQQRDEGDGNAAGQSGKSARMASFGSNVREDREKGGMNSSGPAWTANRWRHLQTEDDSQSGSGSAGSRSSSRAGDADPPESSGLAAQQDEHGHSDVGRVRDDVDSKDEDPWPVEAGWRLAGHDKVAHGRPRPAVPSVSTVAASSSHQAADRPSLDNPAAPGPEISTLPSEAHPNATAVALAPDSSAASVTRTLAHLRLDHGPSSELLPRRTSDTPTRAQASEGLDILARRSPVQDISMAQLQQQHYPSQYQSPSSTSNPPQHQQQHYAQQIGSSMMPNAFQPPPPPNPDAIFWHYRDPSGQVQGPFSARQMQDWYAQGFFSETLLVRRVEAPDYETLGALVIRIGDALRPFLSAPAPKMFMPPGMSPFGQPSAYSPTINRVASPAFWQQNRSTNNVLTGSQNSSRHGSVSEGHHHSATGLMAHAQAEPSPSALAGRQMFGDFRSSQSVTPLERPSLTSVVTAEPAPLDPWADTLPSASPVVSRCTSQHGISDALAGNTLTSPSGPIPTPVGSSRVIGSQPGPIAPIGRLPSTAAGANSPVNSGTLAGSAVQTSVSAATTPAKISKAGSTPAAATPQSADIDPTAAQPTANHSSSTQGTLSSSAQTQPPEIEKVRAQSTSSARPVPTKLATTPSPAVSAQQIKPVAIELPEQRSAATTKPNVSQVQPSSATASASPITGKVSTASQEAFAKQKRSATDEAPGSSHERPLFVEAESVSSPATAASSKPAPWAKTSDSQSVPAAQNATLTLREIQEKEAKEAAVRKAAEKRAHAAQLAMQESAAAERLAREAAESLPTTSTWGTGAAAPTSSATATASAASPWTKGASTDGGAPSAIPGAASSKKKKTLKEIQEEEEAKRKAAVAAAAAQQMPNMPSAGGKGYASSIASGRSAAPSPPVAALSGWTTVGVQKPAVSAASTAPAVRLANTPLVKSVSASTAPLLATRSNSSSLPNSIAASTAATNPRPSTPLTATSRKTTEELANPASSEFLKWCKEALKGLDVPVDDFVQMLLSFPVPIDKATRELISDSVYSSSRTLDGRHFADAFADKRLADSRSIKAGKATPAPSAAVAATPSKPGSFTEAIKFVPNRPQEPNFKIVTKKKQDKKK